MSTLDAPSIGAPSASKPVSVLFVCLGNICRSTMAEGVFRHLTEHPSHPLISSIDSAGTGAYHVGSSPDSRTMRTLKAKGITGYRHSARKVTAEDFETFDWIFAMDEENLEDLEDMRQRAMRKRSKNGVTDGQKGAGKIMLFGDWGGRKGEVIVDPYYGADNGFDIAYDQAVRFSKGFLKHLEDSSKSATSANES